MNFVRTEVYEVRSLLAPTSSVSSPNELEKDSSFGGCAAPYSTDMMALLHNAAGEGDRRLLREGDGGAQTHPSRRSVAP